MKVIYNGIYLISMFILIARSCRVAKADQFKEGAYPAKGKTTWKDSVLFVVLLVSFNIAVNLYPIQWVTAPFLGVAATFYTWLAVRHFQLYRKAKPFVFVSISWAMVFFANIVIWNRLAG